MHSLQAVSAPASLRLLIVVFSPNVLMLGYLYFSLFMFHHVEFFIQYILYHPEAVLPYTMGQGAGVGQTFDSHLAFEVQYARTGFISQVGISFMFENLLDI